MRDFNFELRPADIIAQSNSAIQKMQENNEVLDDARRDADRYINVVQARELDSGGYRNIEEKVRDLKRVIEGFQLANDLDIADHNTLIGAVGSESLIGSFIETMVRTSNTEIDRLNAIISDLDTKIRSGCYCGSRALLRDYGLWSGPCVCITNARARRDITVSMRDIRVDIRDYWLEKAAKYDEIEASTKNLFSRGREVRAEAIRGIGIITQAADSLPNRYRSDELSSWRSSMLEDIRNAEAKILQGQLYQEGLDLTVNQARSLLERYDAVELLETWRSLEGVDKEFFGHLLRGDYVEAFSIHPDELSDIMSYVLTDYAARLITFEPDGTAGCMRHFTRFNNAILGAETLTLTDVNMIRRFRDEYLDMLFAGSSLKKIGYGSMLSLVDASYPRYGELHRGHMTHFALTTIWSDQRMLIRGLRDGIIGSGRHEDTQLWIDPETFHFVNWQPRYTIQHFTHRELADNPLGGIVKIEMSSWITDSYQRNRTDWRVGRLEEYLAEDQNLILSLALRTAGTLVGAYALFKKSPLIALGGIAFSVGSAFLTGDVSDIRGLENLASTPFGEIGLTIGSFAVEELVNMQGVWNTIAEDANLTASDRRKLIEWFGTGTRFRMRSEVFFGHIDGMKYTGLGDARIHHPDIIRNLRGWQNDGINSWLVDDNGVPIINENNSIALQEALTDARENNSQLYNNMNLLLDGNFVIVGTTDMSEGAEGLASTGATELTVLDFITALDEIDNIQGVSLQQVWNSKISPLDREREW